MTREEFLQKMKELEIIPERYSIDGEIREYSQNLIQINSHEYALFYLERGERISEEKFETFEEGLDHLYEEIKHIVDSGKRFGKKLI